MLYLSELQRWHLHWPCNSTVKKLSFSGERESLCREKPQTIRRYYIFHILDKAEMILFTTIQTLSIERFGVVKFFQRLSMTRHRDFSVTRLKLKHSNTITLSFGVLDLLKREISSHFLLGCPPFSILWPFSRVPCRPYVSWPLFILQETGQFRRFFIFPID